MRQSLPELQLERITNKDSDYTEADEFGRSIKIEIYGKSAVSPYRINRSFWLYPID